MTNRRPPLRGDGDCPGFLIWRCGGVLEGDEAAAALNIRSEEAPTCPVCRSSGAYVYHNLTDQLFAAPGAWSLRRCGNVRCGSLWLDPTPRTEDLGAAYTEYYTHLAPSGLRSLFASVVRALLGFPLLPLGVPRARRESATMFLTGRKPGTLLDIGCGGGDFLALMRDRGWQVTGLDFDENAAEAAHKRYGIEVHVGTMADLLGKGRSFDVVTASHVIEHVPDPAGFLSQAAALTGPGGCVVLKTPNAASFGHRRFGECWRGLEPPRHLQVLTPGALSLLAERLDMTANVWTSAAGADHILSSSYFIEKKGHFRGKDLSLADRVWAKVVGLFYAVWAQQELGKDAFSGEEICSVLKSRRSVG